MEGLLHTPHHEEAGGTTRTHGQPSGGRWQRERWQGEGEGGKEPGHRGLFRVKGGHGGSSAQNTPRLAREAVGVGEAMGS